MTTPRINIWYHPSNYGDIRLESVGTDDKKTRVIWYQLTDLETSAMKALRKHATRTSLSRKWSSKAAWEKLGDGLFTTGLGKEYHVDLDAPLLKVQAILSKVLRPDRKHVHVVRIGQGKIEELRKEEFEDAPVEAKKDAEVKDLAPYRKEADKVEEETALAKTGTDDQPVKAATVKKPTVGCPMPTFNEVRLRATRVLRAFLDPGQVEDFEKYQRFVTTGADTGHAYMLTSRNAPLHTRGHGGHFQVFDLDEQQSYCVHDWDVPAEEELLALHCMLSLPGYEQWARGMPDVQPDLVMACDLGF